MAFDFSFDLLNLMFASSMAFHLDAVVADHLPIHMAAMHSHCSLYYLGMHSVVACSGYNYYFDYNGFIF